MQLRRGRVAVLLAGALVALGVVAAIVVAKRGDDVSTTRASPAAAYDQHAPNVIVVMTDDQAFQTMRAMPLTRRLIGDAGTTFDNAFVSYPLCCPSRATFLTGQYAHNNGVRDNHPPAGGYQALDSERTLPVWLSRAGYETGFVGKYLNGYGKGAAVREVPPGWSQWYALPGRNKQRAFDFELNENGKLVGYERSEEVPNYKTKVLADKAAGFVRRQAPAERPFFLWVATNGPHKDSGLPPDAERNPEPAPRDRGRFEGRTAPRRTATNEYDVSDKPRWLRERPLLGSGARREIDRYFVSQLESLQSIDRLVERLVRRLRAAGELDETLIIYTTDNGLLLGEHRLEGKSLPYEEAIHVPLLVRGPGFARGEHDRRLVSNVDLAPTILDLTGARADLTVDGRSIAARAGWPEDRQLLLEVFERKQAFTGLRTRRYTYAEYEDGERELYDLRRDPEQLDNLAGSRRHERVRRRLAARLAELRDCVGPQECG